MAPPLQLDESDWRCAICLDLQYKPCVNACGHGVCFWCVHQAMSPFEASACALCRARFAHLPRVCPRLHALLQAAFPERYQQRARETAELEAERGAESEAVEVEPALAESAARLITGDTGDADSSSSGFLTHPPPLLACNACQGLLFEPSVLPCGHVVCRACVPLQREHCAMPVLSEPGVCMPLDKVVRAAVPDAAVAAGAAGAAARRSSGGGGGDGGAGSGRASSAGGGAGEGAAAAAAGAGAAAPGRDPHLMGPPPEVAELLASGRPLRAVWPEVQRALLRVADTRFVWGGVGCDSCGMMPIMGRRYRCSECPEAIGFDLCGPCHDRGPTGQGRFNQQHTPRHRLEKVEPAGSLGSIYQPDNLSMLVNFLQTHKISFVKLERIPSELRVDSGGGGGGDGYDAARALLAATTLSEYLASKPPSAVLTLNTAQTAGQALRALAAAGVLSAPLFDAATGDFLGFLDLNDLLRAFLALVNVRELTDDNREYRLRTAGLQLEHMPLGKVVTGLDGALVYKAAVGSSLLDVIRFGFLLEGSEPTDVADDDGAQVVHRVGVFDLEASTTTTAVTDDDGDEGDEETAVHKAAAGDAPGDAAGDAAAGPCPMEEDEEAQPPPLPTETHRIRGSGARLGPPMAAAAADAHAHTPPQPPPPSPQSGVMDGGSGSQAGGGGGGGRADGSQQEGIHGIRIMHVVSQSDVIGFISRRSAGLGALADATLAQLGLASKAVVCVPAEMSTINAFATMAANRVSCVGVVSHSGGVGALGANLSSSDLRGLLPQHFAALALPVMQFLAFKSSVGWPHTPPARGAAGGPANEWGLKGHEALAAPQVVSCSPDTPLRDALAAVAAARAHRLYVTDAQRRPAAIVTLTDILRVLVGWQPRPRRATGRGGGGAAAGGLLDDVIEDEDMTAGIDLGDAVGGGLGEEEDEEEEEGDEGLGPPAAAVTGGRALGAAAAPARAVGGPRLRQEREEDEEDEEGGLSDAGPRSSGRRGEEDGARGGAAAAACPRWRRRQRRRSEGLGPAAAGSSGGGAGEDSFLPGVPSAPQLPRLVAAGVEGEETTSASMGAAAEDGGSDDLDPFAPSDSCGGGGSGVGLIEEKLRPPPVRGGGSTSAATAGTAAAASALCY